MSGLHRVDLFRLAVPKMTESFVFSETLGLRPGQQPSLLLGPKDLLGPGMTLKELLRHLTIHHAGNFVYEVTDPRLPAAAELGFGKGFLTERVRHALCLAGLYQPDADVPLQLRQQSLTKLFQEMIHVLLALQLATAQLGSKRDHLHLIHFG